MGRGCASAAVDDAAAGACLVVGVYSRSPARCSRGIAWACASRPARTPPVSLAPPASAFSDGDCGGMCGSGHHFCADAADGARERLGAGSRGARVFFRSTLGAQRAPTANPLAAIIPRQGVSGRSALYRGMRAARLASAARIRMAWRWSLGFLDSGKLFCRAGMAQLQCNRALGGDSQAPRNRVCAPSATTSQSGT